MSQLNAIKSYAKDNIILFPRYLATFSIVFNVIEVLLGSRIRQIAVLDVSSSLANLLTDILSSCIFCSKA